jgi:hypothetical protein
MQGIANKIPTVEKGADFFPSCGKVIATIDFSRGGMRSAWSIDVPA